MFITASMIICSARINELYFLCINPITAYYLLNKLNFRINYTSKSDDYKTEFLRITKYTLDNLKIFIDRWKSIEIIIELTPENIERAQVMFDKLVGDGENSIICPEVEIVDTSCGVAT